MEGVVNSNNSNSMWDFSSVFVTLLESAPNSNGISIFRSQYQLLQEKASPPLFSLTSASKALFVLLSIAQEKGRFRVVSDSAMQALETIIWLIEEKKETSFVESFEKHIFSKEPDSKLLQLLQTALADFVTSRWNLKASSLGIHLARVIHEKFPNFFIEMGKYVPNKNARYWIQQSIETATDNNTEDIQSMEGSEDPQDHLDVENPDKGNNFQEQITQDNYQGQILRNNYYEQILPTPSAPPLELIQNSTKHNWEIGEMREVQTKVLQTLSKLVNVVNMCKLKQYKEATICDDFLESIDNQQLNVEEFQVSMLCVGSMKSGKSTFLSAISGTNVFPISDTAMTAIPSFVRCDLKQIEPTMTCKVDVFKTAIEKLKPEILARKEQNRLHELELASKDVLEAFFGVGDLSLDLKERVNGEIEIEKQLRVLNHLVRLCSLLGIPNPVLDLSDTDFPTITVNFPVVQNMPNLIGNLTLIDSPGPDEQKMTQLKGVVNLLLKKATVKILVMDWQLLQGSANANVQTMVRESSNEIIGNKLTYLLVTKCDLMEEKKKSRPEEIKQGISQAIFGGEIPPERIFLVSARYGRHANMAKSFVLKHNRIPTSADGEWVPELMRDMYGAAYERIIKSLNIENFLEEVEILWKNSNLVLPIEHVLHASYQQAVPNSLLFALNKIATISKPLLEDLQIQYRSKDLPDIKVHEFVEKISNRMKELGELMPSLNVKKQETFKNLAKYLDFHIKQAIGEVTTLFKLFRENSSNLLLEKIDLRGDQAEVANKLMRNTSSSFMFSSKQQAYEVLMSMGGSISRFISNTIQTELSRHQEKWKSVGIELLSFIKDKINQELQEDAADLNTLFNTGLEFQIPQLSNPNLDLDDIKYIVKHYFCTEYHVTYPWYFLFLVPVKERIVEKREGVEVLAKDFQQRIQEVVDSTIYTCQETVNRYIQIYFDTEIQAILQYVESRLDQVRKSLETALNSKIRENEMEKMERAQNLDFLISELLEIKKRNQEIQYLIENPNQIAQNGKTEEITPISDNNATKKRGINDVDMGEDDEEELDLKKRIK